ncbi:hypothetical protein JW978_02790 [Candidatus Dojkabacteria bacterium]|nr:hypothetical protein [Candidatus Dojkabacteria bacterium]
MKKDPIFVVFLVILLLALIVGAGFVVYLRDNSRNKEDGGDTSVVSIVAEKSDKLLLVFNIDQGFSNGLVNVTDNETMMKNITDSLKTLQSEYEVAIQINPIHKDKTKTTKVLDYFASNNIPFYLVVYSSDTFTLGNTANSVVSPYDAKRGVSVSDAELSQYKTKYGDKFKGITVFEVFSFDFTIRVCKTTNPEWCDSSWDLPYNSFFRSEYLDKYAQFASKNDMTLFFADWYWYKFQSSDTTQKSYEVKLNTISQKYPNTIVVGYDNNEPDNASHGRVGTWQDAVSFVSKKKGIGLSDQAWICSDETSCDIDIINQWADSALTNGATILSFEPVWYFWNLPKGSMSESDTVLSGYDAKAKSTFSSLRDNLLSISIDTGDDTDGDVPDVEDDEDEDTGGEDIVPDIYLDEDDEVVCGEIDTNKDSKLSLVDFAAFVKIYGKTCSDSSSDYVKTACGASDLNGDGKISIIDFSSFVKGYNKECE